MTKLIPDESLMLAAQEETQGGGYPLPEKSTVRELMAENARLKADKEFTLSDGQRLLRKQDVEGVCRSPHLCFEHDDWTARCGPCAIEASSKAGIKTNKHTTYNPEAMRLEREKSTLTDRVAQLEAKLRTSENIND